MALTYSEPLRSPQNPTTPGDAYEAAADGLSVRTMRRRISDGSCPACRFGPRKIRVRLEDLEDLGRRIPTVAGRL
jgi:hypothetical protein